MNIIQKLWQWNKSAWCLEIFLSLTLKVEIYHLGGNLKSSINLKGNIYLKGNTLFQGHNLFKGSTLCQGHNLFKDNNLLWGNFFIKRDNPFKEVNPLLEIIRQIIKDTFQYLKPIMVNLKHHNL